MRVGLFAPLINPFHDRDYVAALGRAAEERGFHSIWVGEHVVLFDQHASAYPYSPDGQLPGRADNGMLEPFAALSFLAAATETIRLGTGICLVPQRNPVYTAKSVATVDWLSGGRIDFGVGVGWLKEEFDALGVPFERRGARAREYLEVMRRLWCDEVSAYSGEFYELPACRHDPKPIQSPHPPIYFGGESDAALRRVADLGAGWHGFALTPVDARARIARLAELLRERGRGLGDIDVTVCAYNHPVDRAALEAYAEAGVDQLTLLTAGRDVDRLTARLDQMATEFLQPAASM